MSFLTVRAALFFFWFRASLVAVARLAAPKTPLLRLTVDLNVTKALAMVTLGDVALRVRLDDSSQVVDDNLVLHERFQVASFVDLDAKSPNCFAGHFDLAERGEGNSQAIEDGLEVFKVVAFKKRLDVSR